jgi:DNA-binding XRE family transcriptional regulator
MNKIRQTRERKFMTQEELARLAGLSTPTISDVENNKGIPELSTIKKIAKALDTKPEDIWSKE